MPFLFFFLFVISSRLPNLAGRSENTHSRAPVIGSGIHHDLIWERICFQGSDGWDVIFIAVDDVDYLEAGLLEGLFHGGADYGSLF
jgi:hypothetical protein